MSATDSLLYPLSRTPGSMEPEPSARAHCMGMDAAGCRYSIIAGHSAKFPTVILLTTTACEDSRCVCQKRKLILNFFPPGICNTCGVPHERQLRTALHCMGIYILGQPPLLLCFCRISMTTTEEWLLMLILQITQGNSRKRGRPACVPSSLISDYLKKKSLRVRVCTRRGGDSNQRNQP